MNTELAIRDLEYRGHTVRGVAIDGEAFLAVPDVEAAMPTTDLWNRAQTEMKDAAEGWLESCLKTVTVGSEQLQVIEHMALTLTLHREKSWEQFRDWELHEAWELLLKYPEWQEITHTLVEEKGRASYFMLHGMTWLPFSTTCLMLPLDADSPFFSELGKGEIGEFTVMSSQGEQTGVYVSDIGFKRLYALKHPALIADFVRDRGHEPDNTEWEDLIYHDLMQKIEDQKRQMEELKLGTARLRQRAERNIQAYHALGYECPVEYERESFRWALTDHLDAIKKEALPIEQQMGKFLFEEAVDVMDCLPAEYLWFRFLREKIGIAMTEPAEIRAASLLQPKSAPNLKRDQYHNAFGKWLDKLSETKLLDKVYYEGMRGIMIAQPAIALVPGQTHPSYGIRFAAIGPDLPYGPDLGVVVEDSIIDACEKAHDLLPILADYARSGYAPLIELPVLASPFGLQNVYEPEEKRFYYLNSEDVEDDEDAA